MTKKSILLKMTPPYRDIYEKRCEKTLNPICRACDARRSNDVKISDKQIGYVSRNRLLFCAQISQGLSLIMQ